MSCPEVFPASATSAGSPTADEPAYCRSAAPGSTRPLPLKSPLSQHRLYGTARTVMGSCNAFNRSRPRSSSLPNERSSMLLTRHKVWISTATIACFPTRPLHVCLQTVHSLFADHLPSVAPTRTPPQHPLPRHLSRSASLAIPRYQLRCSVGRLKPHSQHPLPPHQRLPSNRSIRPAPHTLTSTRKAVLAQQLR